MTLKISSSTRKRKRTANRKSGQIGYNIIKADPTFSISPIINSYKIDLAHALFRTVMQPVFREELLSGKAKIINALCVKAQIYIQTYCLQQYVFTTMGQHILSMIMKLANQKATPVNRKMHENFLKAFRMLKTMAGGGTKQKYGSAIKKPLVFLLLLLHCISSTSGNSLSTVNTHFSVISEKKSEIETIALQLYEAKQIESMPVSIKTVIEKYDEKQEQELSGIGNALYYLFHSLPPSGEEQIIKYVEEFNDIMAEYSRLAVKECKKIVENAYEKGMFANYKTKDQIAELETEYEILSSMKEQNKEETKLSFKQTVASAAASALSGDIYTPLAMMYKTIEHVAQRPPDKIENTKMNIEKERGITAEQLLVTSKVYCANSFHIEIEYSEQDKTIKLLGDKIGYQSMRDFTNSVIMNMNTLQKTTATNKDTELVYRSMEQKMRTLEYIVNHLENMVVIGITNELDIKTKSRSANPIAKIRDYFNDQKQVMDTAIATMGEIFPIDARLLREQTLMNEEMARLSTKNAKDQVKISSEYYVNMINIYSDLVRKPLSATVSNLVATVLDLPAEAIETSIDKISTMLTNIIGKMMQSSGGIILLSFLTMTLVLYMGASLYAIKSAASIFYIPLIPFIWTVKVSKYLGSIVLKTVGLIKTTSSQEQLMIEDSPPKKTSGNKTRKVSDKATNKEELQLITT